MLLMTGLMDTIQHYIHFGCTFRYNSFSGINRKVQFRYVKSPSRPSSAVIHNLSPGGIETDEIKHEHRLLLILKWGGELTRVGGEQAQKLGQTFRCMYPEETGKMN